MSKHEMLAGLSDEARIAKYLRHINRFPMLEKDEEFTLMSRWLKNEDRKSLTKIVESHMRLVAKVAKGYRGYGLPLDELIAEGHIGIMQALKHFQPSKGFRFATYAIHWIRSALLNYIFKASSIFNIKPNKEHKKVFFKIKGLKNALGINMQDRLTPENIMQIAKSLEVSEEAVKTIEENAKITTSAMSINAKENEEGIDWVNMDSSNIELSAVEKDELDYRKELLAKSMKILSKTEYEVLVRRRFSDEPQKLEDIAKELSVSRERVRQIEISAFNKLRKHMINLSKMRRPSYINISAAYINISAAEMQGIGILLALPKSFIDFLSRF
ncbi:MAG: RNA polymerase factor sigma-32 [Holosporales bacterium]|jgi:RNA polymerase sigma-32 factor|nr:RNA polymerase factor sigma-32 [Holosporales bacterium]